MKVSRKFTRGALSTTALGMTLALAAPAWAQTPIPTGPETQPCTDPSGVCTDSEGEPVAPTSSTGTQSGDNSITVVGSRIRRNQFNTADPIQLITRDEATQAGFTSTAELLQSNQVTGGTDQINDAYGGFVVAGGPGVNTISLRGLGTTRTLVLLNGRRVAPAGSRGSVGSADLNVLPNAIIDRVEVLNTGASSIYGSDAIAGVINIVTRSRVNGLTAEANLSIPEHGSGVAQRYSLVGGFETNRFRVIGSLEYYTRDSISVGDREFARCPQYMYLSEENNPPRYSLGAYGGRDGPRCFPINNGGVTVNTVGTPNISGRPFRAPGTNGPTDPGQSAILTGSLVNLGPGVPVGYTGICNRFRPLPGGAAGAGATPAVTAPGGGALPGFECVGGGTLSTDIRDTFSPSLLTQDLLSGVEIYTAYGRVTYDADILGNAEFYVDMLVNRRNSSQLDQRQFTLDYPVGSPLIPAELVFRNASGQQIAFLGPQAGTTPYSTAIRLFTDYGNYENRQTVDFVRLNGGVRGDFFFDNWRYDFFAGKTWSNSTYETDLILTDRLAQAMQGCPANTSPGCVSAPAITPAVIGGGVGIPQAFRDFVTAPVVGTTDYTERVFNFTIDGPLFNVWGGPVQLALGVEQREASIDDTPSEESQRSNLFGFTSSTITRGSDSVWEAFGEIEVPLIRESFIHELTLNASARYTEYESYGGDWTYKIGGIISPVRWLSFRGSYGTSYRAPALFEQFLGATSGFLANTNDPCHNFNQSTPQLIRERCLSEGLPIATDTTAGFTQNSSLTVIGLGGAAAGLQAETSENLTFGGVFQPNLGSMGRLSLAVDYFNVLVSDGVAQLSAAQVLSQCYNNALRTTCDNGLITRTPYTGPGTGQLRVIQSFVNISDAKVEGIDYTLRYSLPFLGGNLRFGAAVTQFLERYNRTFPTSAVVDVVGELENPEFTGTFDVGFESGGWNFRYGVEWVDATTSNPRALLSGFLPEDYNLSTDDYFLHTFSARYDTESFGFQVGIRNIFNTDPPMITSDWINLIGNAPLYSGYDLRGRTVFVSSRFSF
jgi:iron complex outermembrane recepter protein